MLARLSNQKTLRVLHVTAGLSPHDGGPTTAVISMAHGLSALGVDVTIYAPDQLHDAKWGFGKPPKLGRQMPSIPVGVTVHLFDTHWPHRYGFSPALASLLSKNTACFDVVHIHSLFRFSTVAAARAAISAKVPFLVRPHGALLPYFVRHESTTRRIYRHVVEQRYLDRAAAIHYTSEEERIQSARCGLHARAVIVPLGVDETELDLGGSRERFMRAHPELDGKQLLVSVARIARQKGTDILAEAFSRLASHHQHLQLVIAGPDDEGFAKTVARMVRHAGLSHRVTWLGLVTGEKKRDLMAATDVWVLPSRAENFGLALVEAMGQGLPVVITDQVNIHREVSACRAGLVTACEASEVAAAIDRVLKDEALRRGLGLAGRRLVRSNYTQRAVAQQLIIVYQQLISGYLAARSEH